MRYAIPCLAFWALLCVPVVGQADNRPFWTEKTSFIEGQDLYVVGVASHARSLGEGRQLALEHGKYEVMNFAQVTNLARKGFFLETQMTYEEMHADGSVTVFRLFRVPLKKLENLQRGFFLHGPDPTHRLAQAGKKLQTLRRSITIPSETGKHGKAQRDHTIQPVTNQRIHNPQRICQQVKPGMRMREVKNLLGPAHAIKLIGDTPVLEYGTMEIWFSNGRVSHLAPNDRCQPTQGS